MSARNNLLGTIAAVMLACAAAKAQDPPLADDPSPSTALHKALRFLERDVPQWPRENKCFSCHNNGDAGRALYLAQRMQHPLAPQALQTTTTWLLNPAGWDDNGGEVEFSDRRLATVQFAAALLEVQPSRDQRARHERAIQAAARLVAEQQAPDGSWPIDAAGSVGSPTTYGVTLATVTAWRVLSRAQAAGGDEFKTPLAKAERWLVDRTPKNVLDAAALLPWLVTRPAGDTASRVKRDACLALIREGENSSGGWGPFVNSRPEPFDTALVLLALAAQEPSRRHKAMIGRGRDYLARTQFDDGSWPETTRPAGGESYSQRMSTTGWATQALLITGATMHGDEQQGTRP